MGNQFKVGDHVVVTKVPDLAKIWGVEIGTPGVISPMDHLGSAPYAKDCGLVVVRIGNFDFWWNVSDLSLVMRLN